MGLVASSTTVIHLRKTRQLIIACREIAFMIIGLAFTCMMGYIFNDGRPLLPGMPANPLLAVFGSIILCLIRAAMVGDRRFHVPTSRWITYQFIFAFALILLLVFEMVAGLLIGAVGVPAWAWLTLVAIGVAYVLTICVSELIVPAHDRDTFEIWS